VTRQPTRRGCARWLTGTGCAHTRGMADLLDNGARTGTQPWARLHAEGHGEHWTAAADYIERNLPAWRRALW
jgi:hypothetical protein